ncbi:hypothetical protein HDC92_000952 [Pedobacter sp. AK017]|uniref:RagB/SusD family nutrient uptake outer membrane protein n=1 Tax=Pedobacter sp. AK017 TaxID=2723073 RepID=UPI00160ACB8F|nr:RagB/SusD family nutrient uptake outer membrane protein [Pedobacter sp. AK017]MBB5437284.1 hypothetical protein [Pedobacter sp. AK017]
MKALKQKIYTSIKFLFFSILLLCSCKKFIEVPPPVKIISSENVFANDQTAISVLNGLYADLGQGYNRSGYFAGNFGLSLVLGSASDELTLYNSLADYAAYYTNTLSAQGFGKEYWPVLYNFIFRCNAVLEGLNDPSAEALTPSIREQLQGEAKFMRAFFYFYLVNLYGDLPIVLTTDYKVSTLLSQSSREKVYEQIIIDLKDAKELLATHYPDASLLKSGSERVRLTQWAAHALLARVYLYIGYFMDAELEAGAIIDHTALFNLQALNATFLKNSREAIWQVQPTNAFFNTDDARVFVIPSYGPSSDGSNPVSISPQLLGSFETGDLRKKIGNWIGEVTAAGTTYYYPYKYKDNLLKSNITAATGTVNMTEYQMMLRLGEQYLIRGEARARQSKMSGAIADLDKIRDRAGLPLIANTNPGISQADLIKKILHERQVELFTEIGQRWFDLKRTGTIDEVMDVVTPLKSNGIGEWHSHQQLFPLPQGDLNKAPNLRQNAGY